jgi:hypothetical protein
MNRARVDRANDAAAHEEARGPHLPGSPGGLPLLAWVFIVLAIGDLAWFIVNAGLASATSLADLGSYALRVVASVAAVLLPAVLLARHPDATTRAATVLFGTILYASVQGLLILGEPLQGFFEGLTPASEDLPGLVPLGAIFDGLIGVVGALGVLCLAVGLAAARRFDDRSATWAAILVAVAAILATIVGVTAVARIDLSGIAMSPTLAAYLGSTVILSILPVVAWAYLTTVGLRGWRSGEEPVMGWRLLAVAGILVLVALALVNVGGLLDIQDETRFRLYGYAIAGAYALGHLGLLVAFAVGLPAIDDADSLGDDEFETS